MNNYCFNVVFESGDEFTFWVTATDEDDAWRQYDLKNFDPRNISYVELDEISNGN